jgi:hypothetical protein
MNSDDLILRELINSPLTTKDDFLTNEDFDNNNINIFNDLVALCVTNGVIAFDELETYDDTVLNYSTYGGRLYEYVNAAPSIGVTPSTDEAYWVEVFPAILAHKKNADTVLNEGGANEVTAAEIRAFIDAGLTTTTDLAITTKTANTFLLTSSTGADVTIPASTVSEAGLMIAADKVKINQVSGVNTGDQSLVSLGAEDANNKVTDFSTLNDVLFPTVQAVETQIVAKIDALVNAAPSALDTLNELAAALGDDANFSGTMTTALAARELLTNKQTDLTASATKYPTVDAVNTGLALKPNISTFAALATGILKNTTGTGAPSIAVNSDLPAMSATVGGAVPTPPNNTTTFLRGDGTFAAPSSSSGVCGIADASGVYTYYATLTLAIAAASSGTTIEVFTDITETGAVSIALKDGVNINLNGHTYTASNSGTNNSFGDNNVALTCSIFNGIIKRSGATSNMFNALGLYIDNVASKITLHGVDVVSTFGYATLTEGILVGGNHLSTGASGAYGLNCRSGSRAYRCYGYSKFSVGIYVDTGDLYDSTGHSDGGIAIATNSSAKLFNCTGRSSAGEGINIGGTGGFMQNCNGYSTSTYGIICSGYATGCSGFSSASYGFRALEDIYNCNGYSTANSGINVETSTKKAYNCTGISTAAYAIYCKGSLHNCTARSTWNNAGGHAVSSNAAFTDVFNCHLEVTHASANCLHFGSAINVYFGANVYKGATTAVNANITQAQTNAPDTYGNIKIG